MPTRFHALIFSMRKKGLAVRYEEQEFDGEIKTGVAEIYTTLCNTCNSAFCKCLYFRTLQILQV